jgi:hypothetical protein
MTAPRPSSPRTGPGRRAVLLGGGLAAGAAGASAVWALTGPSAAAPVPAAPGIPPDDDLMREHGVLKRVLLCYREMTRRIQAGAPVAQPDLHDAALIIHDYIEGFHEGLEEGYVFPRLRRQPAVAGTVTTLLVQHARGRVLRSRQPSAQPRVPRPGSRWTGAVERPSVFRPDISQVGPDRADVIRRSPSLASGRCCCCQLRLGHPAASRSGPRSVAVAYERSQGMWSRGAPIGMAGSRRRLASKSPMILLKWVAVHVCR